MNRMQEATKPPATQTTKEEKEMKITSTRQAREVLKAGMIVNAYSDYEIKVLEVGENDVKCIDVEYDEDAQDYVEVDEIVNGAYYRTFTDFVGNEI